MAYKYVNSFVDLAAAKAATGLFSPNVAKIGNQFVFVNAGSNVPIVFKDNNEFAVVISNEWNPIYSNRKLKVIIQGEVVLNGKVDCYSIEFAQGGHLTINAGARLRIWEGGIINTDAESKSDGEYFTIVEDAVNDSYGEFLLHPNVNVNNHPKVKVVIYSIGKRVSGKQIWQRFTIPCQTLYKTDIIRTNPSAFKYIDLNTDNWVDVDNATIMNKFIMYETSTAVNTQTIIQIQCNIIGNDNVILNLISESYNYYSNSYLGKIKSEKLLQIFNRDVILFVNGDNWVTNDTITVPFIKPICNNAFIVHGDNPTTITLSYKDLVWDPSFEEDETPVLTRGLKSSPKSELILPDNPIFNDPTDAFADIDNSNLK